MKALKDVSDGKTIPTMIDTTIQNIERATSRPSGRSSTR